ncbi:bHLH transcription factor RHL1 [Euphorbia peplus]|nr:bHLH transcription factor RHL1 [Euphorbia peplus]
MGTFRFGNMERQNGPFDNSLELLLQNLGGGKVNDFSKSVDNQHQTPNFSNYYEFLTESSSLDNLKAPTTHVFDSISVPDSTFIPSMSEYQTQLVLNNPGLPVPDYSLDTDVSKSNPYFYMFNSNNHLALPPLKCPEQYDEVDPLNKFTGSLNQTLTRSYSSLTQEASGSTANVSRPRKRAAAPVFRNVTRQRISSVDRIRKGKIAENVKALQELLPQPVEGSQAVVMDKIIEYVKYLKLQMKDLSGSKLGVGFPSYPFIFNEGGHHYRFHGKAMNESLEETLAKLLKMDKVAAIKFLQSKGLYVMPMALAHSLP